MEIKNDYLKINVDKIGATLNSIENLETGQPVLWHGDAAWWSGISPILFPFIGTSKDKSYVYDGKKYDMNAHGFLAKREFTFEDLSDSKISYAYKSTDADYESYPFKFKVEISYELEWSKVIVNWRVINLDDKEMIYTIGGHPAILCEDGDVLTFEYGDETNFYSLEGPLIKDKKAMTPERMVLNADAFPIDTWIYDGVKAVTLLNINKGSTVKVAFDGISHVGIWSPIKEGKMAPFVCIEPWEGLPDFTDASGNLEEKKTATKLPQNSEKAYSYSIEIA